MRLTPCSYGLSRVPFRGPVRRTTGRYVACLGGSETFAKFIQTPFPDLIEAAIGEVCVNLGCQSAGPDVFLRDSAIQSLCHDATVTVIEVLGATNLSNTFYKVHPRRNDRFIGPTEALTRLFPEIDFTEFAFTGHLISKLQSTDPVRFEQVRNVLAATWERRMKSLIAQAHGPVVLLWFADHAPDDGPAKPGHGPSFVTRAMLDSIAPFTSDVVEVVAAQGDTQGMSFAPLDALVAADAMGEAAHHKAARALRKPIMDCMI